MITLQDHIEELRAELRGWGLPLMMCKQTTELGYENYVKQIALTYACKNILQRTSPP